MTITPIALSLSSDVDKLWRQFRPHQMEMVVIKNGRKMFPKLEFRVSGLDPLQYYALCLRMQRVDDMRHKFCAGRWQTCGKGEPRIPEKALPHPDGVQTGEYWTIKNISFDFVRLSNSVETNGENVAVIQSMHKYIPVIDVYLLPTVYSRQIHLADPTIQKQIVAKLSVDCTDFIAVTAYQNQKITEIKIANNPFAKGFREKGEKRRASSPLSNNEPKQNRTMFPFFSPMTGSFAPMPPVDYNWLQQGFFHPLLMPGMPGPAQMGPPTFPTRDAYLPSGMAYPFPVESSASIQSTSGYQGSSLDMTPPSKSSLGASTGSSPEMCAPYPMNGYNPSVPFPAGADYCQMGQSWPTYENKNTFNYGYQS